MQRSSQFELRRWIAATLVAEALGFAAGMGLGRAIYFLVGGEPSGAAGVLFVVGLSTLAGVIEGACLGAGQWRVLRDVVPRVGAGAWIAASATGGALAWILGMSAGPHVPSPLPAPWIGALALVLSGLVLGAVLGGAQAIVLHRRAGPSGWWVSANAVGWMLGLLCVYAGMTLVPDGALTASGLVILGLSGAAMAVSPALATGLVLRAFSRSRREP
ncbi:hypothetical protein OV079_27460 [Nannocystis pusilla]|uniref:Uncharacterized protein n=1 Tax=Nannocystis pusilla TaxID=889268 RepID=A0A9X3J0N7_9BACT|nr:hypothetical protein [Nannocystis pusilla]MCY1009238.1 hypothetical protein [Nannocystis pusilla]